MALPKTKSLKEAKRKVTDALRPAKRPRTDMEQSDTTVTLVMPSTTTSFQVDSVFITSLSTPVNISRDDPDSFRRYLYA